MEINFLFFLFLGIYCVSGNVRQFTVNIASERQRRGLQLRGDILVKCYHRRSNSRETIFSCQFHTCAVSDYTLSFTRQELDVASNGKWKEILLNIRLMKLRHYKCNFVRK